MNRLPRSLPRLLSQNYALSRFTGTRSTHLLTRAFATESSRLQAPETTGTPDVKTSASAQSRQHVQYARPPRNKDLPPLENNMRVILAVAAVGLSAWALFYAYATNSERLASSVMQQILQTARSSSELEQVLGEAIRPEPAWYLNGDPWVNGSIRTNQGQVDLSFRLKGHRQGGTLYFTSIRKQKGEPFTILRFRVIADDGTVVNIAA